MAIEENYQEMSSQFEYEGDVSLKQNFKSNASLTPASTNVTGCFDCNICLDSAHDPVVTLCGHLYCWPCIYKWLQVQSSSPEPDQQQQQNCPVCKAAISHNSLVPLYGRGTSSPDTETKKPHLDLVIPNRPPPGLHALITAAAASARPAQRFHPNPFQSQSQTFHQQQYFPDPYASFAAMPSSNVGGTIVAGIINPAIGMFGEMVFSRMFGGADTGLFGYPYPNPNSYPLMGNGSPRMRRQEMQLDKSLNRVSIFLLCFFLLCLILF